MTRWPCLVAFLFLLIPARAQPDPVASAVPDTALHMQLERLRQADNLEAWIYTWIDAAESGLPGGHEWLPFAAEHAWRQPVHADEHSAWFFLLTNDGYHQLRHGNIRRSIRAYEQAYRYYNLHNAADTQEVLEYVIKPLGNNYTRLGDYERALYILGRGLELADSSRQPALFNNLAAAARWNGDPDAARAYCLQGLRTAAAGSPVRGLLLNTLADAELAGGKHIPAGAHIAEAVRILSRSRDARKPETIVWYSSALAIQGHILKTAGDAAGSAQAFRRALHELNRYFPGSRQREKAKIHLALGHALRAGGRGAAALDQYHAALQLLLPGFLAGNTEWDRSLYGENTLMDALRGMAETLDAAGKPDSALSCYRQAFIIAGKLRKNLFGEDSKRRHQQQLRYMADRAISLAYARFSETADKRYAGFALEVAEKNKAGILLDELERNLRASSGRNPADSLLLRTQELQQAISYYEKELALYVKPGSPEYEGMKTELDALRYELSLLQPALTQQFPLMHDQASHKDAASLLEGIPGDISVTEYFTGPENWYLIRAARNGVTDFRRLGPADSLQTAVRDFTERFFLNGPGTMQLDPAGYFRAAYALYCVLMPGMERGASTCMIIPDGILGILPYDALITDTSYTNNITGWPFLIRRHALTQAYSLEVWNRLQQIPAGKKRGFSGFFIPFDGAGNLPAVTREYSRLKKLLKGSFHFAEAAETGKFLKMTSGSRLVHLSTHAMLLGPDKLPALQFADEKLLISDLFRIANPPELTVLSACQTGAGQLAEGEGIISMARAFAATGCGGIIAGLWNLNDQAAADIMERYYRELIACSDKSRALHLAKIAWLDDPELSHIHKLPYYWAGLVYTGNLLPMEGIEKIEKRDSIAWPAAGALTMLIAAALLLRKHIRRLRAH